MDFAKGIAEKITQVVMNYSEVEIKVREATNDEPWGPPGSLMQELAYQTNKYTGYADVMCMLWRRMLQDNKNNWRRVYKSLVLLSYLLRHGSDKVVMSAMEHLYDMKFLNNYSCIDDHGKDKGACVRQKVKDVIELLEDKERLHKERSTAQKNKNKFVGISGEFSDEYVDSYDNNNNGSEKEIGGRHGDDWQGNEYRDYDDDDDDDGLKRYEDKLRNSEKKKSDGSNRGNADGKTWNKISDDDDDDDDDDFNPRMSEESKKDDDDYGDFAQYEPKSSPIKDDSNNNGNNMLLFDPLGDNNAMSPTHANNKAISPPIVGNKAISPAVVNDNDLMNLGAINSIPTNSVPSYPSSSQGNAVMMMMMQPPLSPGLFHFPAGVPLTNQQSPLQFPVANQGYFLNYNKPMSGQGQPFGPAVNYQAQPIVASQNVLQTSNTFQVTNQKSLI